MNCLTSIRDGEFRKEFIIMCKDFNATYEYTLQKLKNKLNISEMEAEEQMKLYW